MSYEVQDQTVRMPVVVRDALAAGAGFVVPLEAAARYLPDGLVPLQPLPGRALLSLTAIHYRDNDLGDYHELSIAFFVVQQAPIPLVTGPLSMLLGRGGTYIHRLPVDQEFSRAAGRQIWGFPKTVEDLTVTDKGDEVVCRWLDDGEPVLTFSVSAPGDGEMSTKVQRSFSSIEGRLHKTRFLMRATGFGSARKGGAVVELGQGEAADELRSLGLPARPAFAMSMAHMQARFDAPTPIG